MCLRKGSRQRRSGQINSVPVSAVIWETNYPVIKLHAQNTGDNTCDHCLFCTGLKGSWHPWGNDNSQVISSDTLTGIIIFPALHVCQVGLHAYTVGEPLD